MKKWSVLLCLAFLWTTGYSKKKQEMVKDDRIWWCETACKISYPVFREPLFVFGGI